MIRRFAAVVVLLAAGPAYAQTPPASAAPPARDKAWSFSASAYTFIVPDGADVVQPLLTADRGRLHLEARYNYEGTGTGSLWVGANFSGGDAVWWELTPLIGGVFGDITGVAPGYKGSIGWRGLELYSESEYVIDTDDTSESFLYNWSELTWSPVEDFRFGLVVQRTRVYQTARDVQRGLIAGYSYKQADFTFCVFNPDDDKPAVAFSVGFRF